jgi:hypothetical protein
MNELMVVLPCSELYDRASKYLRFERFHLGGALA